MESNNICGKVLSKATAEHYLELTQSLHNLIIFTLDCDNKYCLASQKQDTWSLRSALSSRPPGPTHFQYQEQNTFTPRGILRRPERDQVRSRILSGLVSEHAGSLWTIFARAMDQDRSIYEMRNWFSHDFAKLELALQDEAAWVSESKVKARKYEENQPEYTRDTMAVQLELVARQEKFIAMTKRIEINDAAEAEWVVKEVEGEEWVSDTEEVNESLWDYASNTDEDSSECTEDLPASSSQDPDDWAYDSGYEDDEGLPDRLCKAPASDAGSISATI
ncbi:unnamed protein product [Alternaria alternata]